MSDRAGGLGPPIRSTQIHRGTIVNLRASDYRRPDGSVVHREVMDHPGAVVMVPVEGDHVLLVRQPRERTQPVQPAHAAASTLQSIVGMHTSCASPATTRSVTC